MLTFIPMFASKFISITFILWLNSWVLFVCVQGKRHFTISSSNFRLQAQALSSHGSMLRHKCLRPCKMSPTMPYNNIGNICTCVAMLIKRQLCMRCLKQCTQKYHCKHCKCCMYYMQEDIVDTSFQTSQDGPQILKMN